MEERKRNEEPEAADNAGGDEYGYSSAHRKTNNPSTDVNNNEAIELRKAKVLDLDSMGYTQDDIAEELGSPSKSESTTSDPESDISDFMNRI